MFRRLPQETTLDTVSVSGFTRYKTKATDLPAAERAKIDDVADRIAQGRQPGHRPIVGVLLVGHSDQDLSRGPEFERKVSLDRANEIRDALVRAVKRRGGAALAIVHTIDVAMRTTGIGARERVFTSPKNEAQRAANRRVVMFLAEASTPNGPRVDSTYPVPPQKAHGAGPNLDKPPRPSALVAFSIPILGSTSIAGAPQFSSGPPRRPAIKHDHGFLDDGKGNIDQSKRQQPTDRDRASKEIWMKVILGGAMVKRPDLKDATAAYKHFLADNNGLPFTVRYDGFVSEDTNGKSVLSSAVEDTRTAALDIFDTSFPRPSTTPARNRIQVTSTAVVVGRNPPDVRYPYPDSENWQKAIGGHSLWLSADALIDSDPVAKKRTVAITLTLHAEDMFNFNPGGADIATNTADSENGRFEIVGLATEFLQTGIATRTITFTVPLAKQSDNRVAPANLKVAAGPST